MKDLSFPTLIAVFEEILGRGLFWMFVVAALVVTVCYFYVLLRDRHIGWKKFLVAQFFMPVGAVAAVWFVMAITHSGLGDIGGPIDVIILLAVACIGAIGIAILVYTAGALFGRKGSGN